MFEESRDRWLNVPPLPGCIIVNSGDLITRMTNGKFKSALHRVYKTHDGDRYSTPFFCYPNLKVSPESRNLAYDGGGGGHWSLLLILSTFDTFKYNVPPSQCARTAHLAYFRPELCLGPMALENHDERLVWN